MKNLIVLISVVIFSLVNTVSAFADNRDDNSRSAHVAYGNKGSAYTVDTFQANERDDEKSCSIHSDTVTLDAYLDGDTPTETAYNDYLEDLSWWANEVNTPCTVIAETL